MKKKLIIFSGSLFIILLISCLITTFYISQKLETIFTTSIKKINTDINDELYSFYEKIKEISNQIEKNTTEDRLINNINNLLAKKNHSLTEINLIHYQRGLLESKAFLTISIFNKTGHFPVEIHFKHGVNLLTQLKSLNHNFKLADFDISLKQNKFTTSLFNKKHNDTLMTGTASIYSNQGILAKFAVEEINEVQNNINLNIKPIHIDINFNNSSQEQQAIKLTTSFNIKNNNDNTSFNLTNFLLNYKTIPNNDTVQYDIQIDADELKLVTINSTFKLDNIKNFTTIIHSLLNKDITQSSDKPLTFIKQESRSSIDHIVMQSPNAFDLQLNDLIINQIITPKKEGLLNIDYSINTKNFLFNVRDIVFNTNTLELKFNAFITNAYAVYIENFQTNMGNIKLNNIANDAIYKNMLSVAKLNYMHYFSDNTDSTCRKGVNLLNQNKKPHTEKEKPYVCNEIAMLLDNFKLYNNSLGSIALNFNGKINSDMYNIKSSKELLNYLEKSSEVPLQNNQTTSSSDVIKFNIPSLIWETAVGKSQLSLGMHLQTQEKSPLVPALAPLSFIKNFDVNISLSKKMIMSLSDNFIQITSIIFDALPEDVLIHRQQTSRNRIENFITLLQPYIKQNGDNLSFIFNYQYPNKQIVMNGEKYYPHEIQELMTQFSKAFH